MKKSETICLENISSARELGKRLSTYLQPGFLILMNGEMGTGKTQMTRFMLEAKGEESVSSPTFSLHNVYEVLGLTIHHFDLYRMESDHDLERSGFWDALNDTSSAVIVEWADRLNGNSWYPKTWNVITMVISHGKSEASRNVILSGALDLD